MCSDKCSCNQVFPCPSHMSMSRRNTSVLTVNLSKSKFGPVLHWLSALDRWWSSFRWRRLWRILTVLALVHDGKAPLGPLRQVEPGQKVRRGVLGFHTGTGAHLGLAPLVQSYKPLPPTPVIPVHQRGVCVIAAVLEPLSELTVICEFFLKGNERQKQIGTMDNGPWFGNSNLRMRQLGITLRFRTFTWKLSITHQYVNHNFLTALWGCSWELSIMQLFGELHACSSSPQWSSSQYSHHARPEVYQAFEVRLWTVLSFFTQLRQL